jgi:hypothetical protein
MRHLSIRASLAVAAGLSAATGSLFGESTVFHKPVRLQAEGQDIDAGAVWGHTSPCLADVDGDGVRDLVVGDYSGKFRFFRNIGSNLEPTYAAPKFLMAGDVEAEVNIYCCIGSSPTFADFDGDGTLDLLSGSYDPGECYWFRGLGQGRFAARKTIMDKSGKPILRVPSQQNRLESFGSWPVMVDWNDDGKLDLLVGAFGGEMFLRLNESSGPRPEFSTTNIMVQADGKELQLPDDAAHAAPAIVDWDGDGRWDIVSGSDSGAVFFYRNTGVPGRPQFAAPETLVPKHQGKKSEYSFSTGYSELVEADAEPIPGIRTQIAACDYNGDGKIDLLVGDHCSYRTMKPGLTPDDREAMHDLFGEIVKTRDALFSIKLAVREDIEKRYPDEPIHEGKTHEAWIKAYNAMCENPLYKLLEAKMEELNRSLEKYLVKPITPDANDPMATCHGYVWLFIRK